MKRLITLAVVLLAVTGIAQAKWSKASSDFIYDGITVQVTDRHMYVGAMMDTYGYTTFKNDGDTVDVDWRCYGILNHTGQMVLVDEGEFTMCPRAERKEVYSYNAGHFTHKDFSQYVVSIQTTKKKPQKDTPPPVVATDNVYDRYMKHKQQGTLTQQDYSDALDWLETTYAQKINPITNQLWALQNKGDEKGVDKLISKNQALFDMFSALADDLERARQAGKLDSSNKAKMDRLQKKIEDDNF